jgi:hypothetical protein
LSTIAWICFRGGTCASTALKSRIRRRLRLIQESLFDDPALGQNGEAMEIGTLDDLHLPASRRGDSLRHFWSLIAAIGEICSTKGHTTNQPKAAAGCRTSA